MTTKKYLDALVSEVRVQEIPHKEFLKEMEDRWRRHQNDRQVVLIPKDLARLLMMAVRGSSK